MSKIWNEGGQHDNPALSTRDRVYCDYTLRAPDAVWVCNICGFEDPMTRCPRCHSLDCHCFDERTHWFRSLMTGEEFAYPIGYFVCHECKTAWGEGRPLDAEQIDDERLL